MLKIPTIKNGTMTIKEFLDKPDSESTIRDLLGSKAPRRTEIEVSFFQACNLRCAFCWQDHDDTTGISSIKEKAASVIEYLNTSSHLKREISVSMTGGELFQDGMSQEILDDLLCFMKEVNEAGKKLDGRTLSFTIISSLFFNDDTGTRVLGFLQELDEYEIPFALATSWDPVGRPTRNFEKNLMRFNNYIGGITTVMTKPSMQKIIDGTSEFHYYYDRYRMDFDYYVPTAISKSMMPSDENLRDFFVFLVEHYPMIGLIQSWKYSEVNPVTCGSLNKITILPDGSMVTCRQVKYDHNDFNTEIITNSNANIIEKYISNQECLSCPYFNKCTLSCFVMSDHKEYTGKKTLERCLYKYVFEFIGGSNA